MFISLLSPADKNQGILFGDSASNWMGQIQYAHVNDSMVIHTAGAEKMRITSAGRVGIGRTSPGTALSVAGQSESWQLALSTDTGSGAVIGSPSANVLAFGDWAGTERMRITSAGTLMVGASTNNTNADVSPIAQMIAPRGTTTYPLTLSTAGAAVTGDQIRMTFNYGTGWSAVAYVASYVENAGTAFTGMAFGTYSGALLERMRITSGGALQVPNQPYFKYGIGTKTITSAVRFGTDWGFGVSTDRDCIDSANFNKANGRFTAPVAGTYMFGVTIMRNNNVGAGPIDFQIVKNEPSVIGQSSSSTYGRGYAGNYTAIYEQCTIVVPIRLAANDYVALDFTGDMSTYNDDSWFYGYLLG